MCITYITLAYVRDFSLTNLTSTDSGDGPTIDKVK